MTTHLSALLPLLSSSDPVLARQGLALACALDDGEVWSALAESFDLVGPRIQTGRGPLTERVWGAFALGLASWRGAGRLEEVEGLRLAQLEDLRDLSGARRLVRLSLQGNPALTDLSPLGGLPRLTHLTLAACPALTDLAPLAACPALTHVELLRCPALTDLAPLAACPALTHLRCVLLPAELDFTALAGARPGLVWV